MNQGPNRYYWYSQLGGWTLYSLLLSSWNFLQGNSDIRQSIPLFVAVILLGIALSHLYRYLINRSGWLNMRVSVIIPRLIIGSLVFGVLYAFSLSALLDYIDPPSDQLSPDLASTIGQFFSWTVIFLLWSTGYLAYHYLRNYEREEIKNLRLQSSQHEVELASLKAQLNPHFIFNAMNSIRALIEEDPILAKSAVTKLSNLLRNSLMADKRNLVRLDEELALVKDHLSLEQIRYEERLRLSFEIAPGLADVRIPPMMIQTLVENAIKHGIAKLTGGGELHIHVHDTGDTLSVDVTNSGQVSESPTKTGIGLSNLRRRLNILYNGRAELTLSNMPDHKVKASLIIPKTKEL